MVAVIPEYPLGLDWYIVLVEPVLGPRESKVTGNVPRFFLIYFN